MTSTTRLLRWTLAASGASAFLLTFVWPFTVSSDPGNATFRVLAIGTFIVLLASVGALALLRLRDSP